MSINKTSLVPFFMAADGDPTELNELIASGAELTLAQQLAQQMIEDGGLPANRNVGRPKKRAGEKRPSENLPSEKRPKLVCKMKDCPNNGYRNDDCTKEDCPKDDATWLAAKIHYWKEADRLGHKAIYGKSELLRVAIANHYGLAGVSNDLIPKPVDIQESDVFELFVKYLGQERKLKNPKDESLAAQRTFIIDRYLMWKHSTKKTKAAFRPAKFIYDEAKGQFVNMLSKQYKAS